MLMQRACLDHPDVTVYVLSDADPYYEKQGCVKAGSVLEVNLVLNLEV